MILSLEVLFTICISLAQWFPTTPGSQSVIINCLGRNEIFFDFDYFAIGGNNRKNWEHCDFESPVAKLSCFTTLVIGFTVQSNLIEIFLTGRVLWEMKNSTNASASLMTRQAYQNRKRYIFSNPIYNIHTYVFAKAFVSSF